MPLADEFRYLWVLFMSEGRLEEVIDRQIGAVSAMVQTVYWSVEVKVQKAGLLFTDQSLFLPSPVVLNYWVVTDRMRSGSQVAEMNFLSYSSL